MPETRVKLPEDLDKRINHFMIDYNISLKGEAIVEILKRYFKEGKK